MVRPTALYGIRAANGAIIITTKSAKAGKMQITYTGTYGLDEVNKIPDVQTKFSQGYLGVYDKTSFLAIVGTNSRGCTGLRSYASRKDFQQF